MSLEMKALMDRQEWREMATGTWFYDQAVPMRITVWAKPARFAGSRFDEYDNFIESSPIPETKDGYVYFYWPGGSGDHLTLEDAKAAAEAESWGPIKWD